MGARCAVETAARRAMCMLASVWWHMVQVTHMCHPANWGPRWRWHSQWSTQFLQLANAVAGGPSAWGHSQPARRPRLGCAPCPFRRRGSAPPGWPLCSKPPPPSMPCDAKRAPKRCSPAAAASLIMCRHRGQRYAGLRVRRVEGGGRTLLARVLLITTAPCRRGAACSCWAAPPAWLSAWRSE